ncbi:MAG: bifunctional glutamate N-acetyltransferase/amino-acid acetyltransferase ArgJ [Candidatus Hydrogenedentes bacterium]|nr:bifunctional glutamate N-acetyltransferase/amino-acid acetyltransferase ArgJ [Candidatus Hydrogenedentota bacterium]
MTKVSGGVCAPKGYRASGVAARIKPSSTRKDCALIVSDAPATVAGMFTKNLLKSPPVVWNAAACLAGKARAVFINSGNANAATGERGAMDVCTTAGMVADGLRIETNEVCICSTGVIGVPLPMDRIRSGVTDCLKTLGPSGSADAAHAIMTTDTVPKELAIEVTLQAGTIRFGAIAKGSGMIAPDMATMICVITCDAEIAAPALDKALRAAVNASFNCITIDNDMSTSDTVLCFANGASGVRVVDSTPDFITFTNALKALCVEMAKLLVRDGEGATKFVEIAVEGAQNDEDARTIARAVANSMLVKTAFFGQDPNWGRIACAAGYAGVDFDPAELALWLDNVQLVSNGAATEYREEDAAAVMKQAEFRVRIRVGAGSGAAVFWTSDLSHDYVSINADYRS